MVDETDTQEATVGKAGVFANYYCKSLFYLFALKSVDFKIDDFLVAVGGSDATVHKSGTVTCAPKSAASDYHLHVNFRRKEDEISLRVSFYDGYKEPAPSEREPYAEDFLQWVDQFFLKREARQVRTHAEFVYPSSVRSARYFLLPLTTALGPNNIKAEIDGISFLLPSEPHGVEKIWLTQRPEELSVYLSAEMSVDFSTFDPGHELSLLSQAVGDILEERKQ